MDAPSDCFSSLRLTGRNRRLLYEWKELHRHLAERGDVECRVEETNGEGLPVAYMVAYHVRSICGVEHMERLGSYNPPRFAREFLMRISLPKGYPCVDAAPDFRFLTADGEGRAVEHPWHPNIRFFGEQAGRVCLNMTDTYCSLAWGVERVAHYLRYDLYHAKNELPYPEDLRVAQWVITQGEPEGWVFFEQ